MTAPSLSILDGIMKRLIIGIAIVLITLGLGFTAVKLTNTLLKDGPVQVEKEMSVDEYVHFLAKLYKVNEVLARSIIGCESQWKADAVHENWRYKIVDGFKIRDYVWSRDRSYFQLNDYYQAAPMAARGWDILDWRDNLQAGFYLLKTQGTQPWLASVGCWRDNDKTKGY